MIYKIIIEEIKPPETTTEKKYEERVEIYSQRTNQPINLKAIIDAFNSTST